MRALWIINPSSGKQNAKTILERIIGKLTLKKICHEHDIYYTQKKNDAFNRASILCENDYDFIVAVGGDGTINEVIGGIIKSNSHIPLAILPAGTVNDFATYLGLPRSCDSFFQMIENFQTKDVDVGKIGEEYFANVVAGGAFSDISFRVPKTKKARFGALAYYIEGILAIPELFTSHQHLKIKADNQYFEEDSILFLISNTKSIGGITQLVTKANVDDGLFDVLIIRKCEVTDLIALSKDILLSKHLDSPFLNYFQAKNIYIETNDANIHVDVDGEIGPQFPIEIINIPQALKLLVPKK